MRADIMTWVNRAVAVVFLIGLLALLGVMVVLIRSAEGVPPLPVFIGVIGLVGLILLAGACLALISVALSARRGAEALERLSRAEAAPRLASEKVKAPFDGPSLREVVKEAQADAEPPVKAPSRPDRPAGRVLVAQR
ncbi:hypothetical protein [Paracoccus fistulariae]|uniref:Lipopolysaccharide assembly protein A domain-containing protein n=1 Tax=Paracoccus fistulariae TaxID=658446 RepID=A0ABY7SHI9_9RHOB|nr:hypothetical protein [Paracoccus fistulariae]MDB6181718.1 hypothetical protein [Paracoccus fistulariae]WCR05982.1 hypothetical protein JHX87_10675 [Paracoccus fistulariae]